MRIAISGMFWNQPTVGSGQYLHGMLGELARIAPEHEYLLLLPAYLADERRTTNDERHELPSSSFFGLSSLSFAHPSTAGARTSPSCGSNRLACHWRPH